MATKPPKGDPVQDAPQVTKVQHAAAGIPAIGHTLRMAQRQMGVKRTALTLLSVNQKDGFDCPGCAWPEPDHRHKAEFCENGAKAVAEEATLRRVTPEFFAAHSVADLATRSGYWLGQQGRLTHPVYLPEGGEHYEPVTWERAFDIVAEEIAALDSPDESVFYTSGRTSNEAAFLYQLSRASSARTTCRTARTCATSRPARPCRRPSASARAASCWRTSTSPI